MDIVALLTPIYAKIQGLEPDIVAFIAMISRADPSAYALNIILGQFPNERLSTFPRWHFSEQCCHIIYRC